MGRHRDAEMLARLRVAAATGQLPSDVGAWACGEIERPQRRAARKLERNEHLRTAGLLLPGSSWDRAVALAELVRRCRLNGSSEAPPFGSSTWFVWSALRIDPRTPGSPRHLLRVID